MDIHWETGDEWQVGFLSVLRKLFEPISEPVNGCLVVMNGYCGGFHLGVYNNYAVEHNYECGVIISDLGTITAEFKRVRFYDCRNKTL